MQENIIISFDRTVAPVDLHGFKDVVTDVLHEQGSKAVIDITTAHQSGGCGVTVQWKGSYRFTTPDGHIEFSKTDLEVVVTGEELNHDLLMKLLAYRGAVINRAYREALEAIRRLAMDIESGALQTTDGVEYLRLTVENALEAFPETE